METARFFAVNRRRAICSTPHGRSRALGYRSAAGACAIVNISSIAAGRAVPGIWLVYGDGVEGGCLLDNLTRTMALEWAGKGLAG